jgi:hypothetical protein
MRQLKSMKERTQFKNTGLEKYADTEAEKQTLDALMRCGGDFEAMSKQLGISPSGVTSRLWRLRRKAAKRGWSPDHDMTKQSPDGFHVKGVSSYYGVDDETGELKLRGQWVKTNKDREDIIDGIRIACEELASGCVGVIDPTPPPEPSNSDLLATYLLGDHHMGMFSWAQETGADYDCEIADRCMRDGFRDVAAGLPATDECLVVSAGDFFHADDHNKGVTPQSGHPLDTDSRHSRVIAMGIAMWRDTVLFLLTKHRKVHLRIVAGNHDPMASIWLAHAMRLAFDREPRVHVDVDPRVYRFFEWGRCMIMTTHGDRCKLAVLPQIMAVDAPEMWGRTKYRHVYTGHVHHKTLSEERGCKIETLSVLCPGDSWHVGAGYRSERGMQGDLWHRERGRVLSVQGGVEYL